MKWCLNVSLKYLTPSSALRDSRLRSPLCISPSPTSLFFSAGPRFPASTTVRSSQSSISYQEVDPSNGVGMFVVIPLAAVHWSVDSARYAPTIDSTGCVLLRWLGSHQDLPHSHSSSVLLKLYTIPIQRNLVHDKILFFLRQPALRHHFVVVILFFLCKPHVARIQ